MFKASVVYEKNLRSEATIVVNQGGTSSGKTYSILQVLFTKAAATPGLVITVVGQDIPNLKKGALRDAADIVAGSPILQSLIATYHKGDRIYTFTNGSVMEFTSYTSPQAAKSGKRDILFINEANGIPYPIYYELSIRTYQQIFIDYNPNIEFWAHELVLPDKAAELLISDHRHNPFIPESQHKRIESIPDPELWKVYARGLTGKIEGLVYPNYQIVGEVPEEAKLVAAGLDFGFTNDPTAFELVYLLGGILWIDELLYEPGLTNPDISARLEEAGLSKRTEIIADSAEPKSIEELRRMGWNIKAALKGPDSIKNGIDILKRYPINITSRSTGIRKEIQSYKWAVDKQGKALNEPIGLFNHGLDGVRYVALNKIGHPRPTFSVPKFI